MASTFRQWNTQLAAGKTAATKSYPLMTRSDIEALIADGLAIIIVNQHVLKADPFLKYHPGGEKAIKHMVGRDATDEVTVFVTLERELGYQGH
jgi:delta8-fatty-acid desaturase